MNETPHEKNNHTTFTVGGGLCAAPYWCFMGIFSEWHIGHSLHMHLENPPFAIKLPR